MTWTPVDTRTRGSLHQTRSDIQLPIGIPPYLPSRMPSLQKNVIINSIREVTFHLPKQFKMPSLIETMSEDDFAFILLSAPKIFEFQKQSALDVQEEEFLKQQVQQKTSDLSKQHEREQKRLKEDLEDAKNSFHKLNSELEKLRIENTVIRDITEKQAEKRIDDFKQQISKIEQRLEHEKQKAEEEIKRIQNEKKELQDKLTEKQMKMSNSAKRGNIGENYFDELTLEKRPSWKLTNTSGITDAMDRFLEFEGIEVRIDVKNHEKKVSYKDDITKFKHNMKTHTETTVGILIALTACINDGVKDRHEVFHEWTPSNQLLIYFPHFTEKYLETGYDYMEHLMLIAKHFHFFINDNQTDEKIKIRNALAIDKLQNAVKRLEEEYTTFTKDEKKIKDNYIQHYNFLTTHFDNTRKHFKNILDDAKETIDILAGHQEYISEESQQELETPPAQLETPKWVTDEEKKLAKKTKSKTGK